ncbi:MAG: hypothetical protein PVG38_01570 [Gammaproteobacteria bacterium]
MIPLSDCCRRLLSWATIVLISAFAGCATTVQPRDTALLVTAADLEDFGATLPADFPAFEQSRKTKLLGSLELEYEFDARVASTGYPYVYSSINRESTVSSAVAAYGAVKAGVGMAGIEARDDSERFRYGDWSYFGTLVAEGGERGFVFYMRDDLTVYLLMLSGMRMNVEDLWEQLLLPRLEMLTRTQLSSR